MAIAVSYGGDDEFRALVYGADRNPGTLQYLENQVSNFSNTLTDAGRSFLATTKQLYDQFNGSNAMYLARMAANKVGSLFQSNTIRSIWDLAELQNAPPVMQRWIMAEESVRKLYQEQKCAGYGESYVDMHPGTIGSEHYDWRRVMHGLVTADTDGMEKTVFYLDELAEGDRELYIDEKESIISTWAIVADLMKYGKDDPTCSLGGKL